MYERSLETTVHFHLEIGSDVMLSEAVLFVPVPVCGGFTLPALETCGGRCLEGEKNFSVIDLYSDRDALFLKLVIVRGEDPMSGGEEAGSIRYSLESVENLEHALDAEDPEKYSYVFRPRYDVSSTGCTNEDAGELPAVCRRYSTMIYAATEPSGANITVEAVLQVRNQWRIFRDYSNGYEDRIRVAASTVNEGWFTAEGQLIARIGDPDPFLRPRVESERLNLTPPGMKWQELLFQDAGEILHRDTHSSRYLTTQRLLPHFS